MPARSALPTSAPPSARFANAGELSLRTPRGVRDTTPSERLSKSIEKQCRRSVKEEWTKVDDKKLAKMREMLADLKEERQPIQLLKLNSDNSKAQKALESTRVSVDTRFLASKQREQIFVDKKAGLQRHVMDNEKSLQELQAQIDRDEKKAKEEQEHCRRCELEIEEVQAELAEQEIAKETEQKRIAQTIHYKKFLEKVVLVCEQDFENDIDMLMNRHSTLEAGNRELHRVNVDLTNRLDREREECLRMQTKLQNEHLMISSRLPEFQATFDKLHAECQALQQRLNRTLEEKGLKESEVGIIQMAIEQLFTRAVNSCRQKQRRKAMIESTENRQSLGRGDKSDARLDRMLKQITERVEDLTDMCRSSGKLGGDVDEDVVAAVEETDVMNKVKFVKQRGNQNERQNDTINDNSELLANCQISLQKLQSEVSGTSTSSVDAYMPRQSIFVTEDLP